MSTDGDELVALPRLVDDHQIQPSQVQKHFHKQIKLVQKHFHKQIKHLLKKTRFRMAVNLACFAALGDAVAGSLANKKARKATIDNDRALELFVQFIQFRTVSSTGVCFLLPPCAKQKANS